LDNFHAGHSVVDGGTGRKFRSRRDASVTGVGNNFGSHEPGVPTYVVKLTKESGRAGQQQSMENPQERIDCARPSMSSFLIFKQERPRRSMKKFVAFLSVVSLATFSWAGTAKEDSADRLQKSSEVLTQIANAPDKGIPEEVLAKAKCVAIVPHLVKGGFVFGGKHGRGVATCRTADGWSAPAFISVGGGSWGLQIGVEGVDLIMLIMNDKGMQQLLSSKFQVSGEGSAAAGPVGRHASAGTDWKLDTQMLTYSRSKGAFAGLTLEGAVIQQDADSTTAVYGKDVAFKNVLLGKVPTPEMAKPFVQSVTKATNVASAKEAADNDKK
jgi:lipid-binding SYLF domain-containing protein